MVCAWQLACQVGGSPTRSGAPDRYPKVGVTGGVMPHRPEWMEGMERLVRHDGESRDTDRLTWSHHRRSSGGQGARREAGSERLEENHRVVINGSNPDR